MTDIDHEHTTAGVEQLDRLLPLFRELNGLKRVRVAGKNGSWAERLFIRAWARLIAGEDIGQVAREETASAMVATSLAGVDAEVLAAGGIPTGDRREIIQRAFDTACRLLPPALTEPLRAALSDEPTREPTAAVPPFVSLLAAQPRAGATRPGHPRVMLEPAENHAEHCAVVAVNGVLAVGVFGADPAEPFLTGLAHHLHNAYLPDAGDAGDSLLGEHQRPLIENYRARSLQQLPVSLHEPIRHCLATVYRADTPAARAFQTADSVDRVLEMEWHARSAAFTLETALGEMDIIHPGPVQAFQREIMRVLRLDPTPRSSSPCN